MAKGKKDSKRKSKKQLAEILGNFFRANPGETFSLKRIFKVLNMKTHPMKMLAIDIMEEMGLVTRSFDGRAETASLVTPAAKVDIEDSKLLAKVRRGNI